MEFMTARVRLNSVLLPLLTLGMLVMQLLDPSKIWQALIVAFGGLWLDRMVLGVVVETPFTIDT